MSDMPAEDCYQHLGFQPFDGQGPFVAAGDWKRLQDSQKLADIKSRYLHQRDRAGQPLVDYGYVVGSVPALRISDSELERLLQGLEEGLQAGCATVVEWQKVKIARRTASNN